MDDKWKSQMRKGFIELCVLLFLAGRNRAYGLEILDGVGDKGIELSEGTLYPLMARMQAEGYLDAAWDTEGSGHPRKYYSLTAAGRKRLGLMSAEFEGQWETYVAMKEEGHGRA